MSGALQGIRVLDFSHVLSAPYGTMLLGDMGADIIKIENVGGGDALRSTPPRKNTLSAYYFCANRNKRCISVDLKKPEAKGLIFRLAKDSDVFVENFRPGVMERLGFGYEAIKKVRPDVIYGSLSAFGDIGPYKDKPGFELIIQSIGGLVSVTTGRDGRPSKVQPQVVDISGGMFLAIAILGAIVHRQRTGQGQQVKTSLLEGLFALMTNFIYMNLWQYKIPYQFETRNPMMFPSQSFKTKDGYFSTVVVSNHWPRLCRALGKPEWIDHPDYSKPVYRVQHYEEMEAMLEAVTVTKTTTEWLEILEKHDVACSQINSVEQMLADPQINALNLFRTLSNPKFGEFKVQVPPWHMSKTEPEIKLPPPVHGEHTSEILSEFGYSTTEIAKLKYQGVVTGE
jgi:crotonobetainyl-CoA:carnitine CoA-transferase CaiB-like acyl-CoA transferase